MAIDFTDFELEILSEILDETVDVAGKYTDDDDEDKEYKRLLKIQKKIECERKDRTKWYKPNEKPKKKSRFDDIIV